MYWSVRQEFDRAAGRAVGWGIGLLAVSAVLLGWFGFLLLTPFTATEYQDEVECDAPVSDTYAGNTRSLCHGERDWPELVGILALAVPTTAAGTALWAVGSSRKRTTDHVLRLLELQESEQRDRTGS
ncbi:hypothetical protein [uncultured Streptomyces sp.]|uniref:hypothetical protein n=1 Tax=uncultured Streptomyces sp. TaxID=174707 RepID=UPI00260D95DE|nr:hypothetical protein [uncultured Streptomyces sp.]